MITPPEHLIFRSGPVRIVNGMALDLGIAQRVFAFIESSERDMDLMEEIPDFPTDLVEAAKRSGGAIFPDGFAVLGRDEDLSHYSRVSVSPPAQTAPVLVEREPQGDGLAAEGIPVIEARPYASRHANLVEEKQALLYLTQE